MFNRTLAAIDGSRASAVALRRAVAITEDGGRLGLIAAVHPVSMFINVVPGASLCTRQSLVDAAEREAVRWVEEAANQVPTGIPITKIVRHGRLPSVLVAEASCGIWDLLVVGPAVRHPRFIRGCPIPVLVAGAETDFDPITAGDQRDVQERFQRLSLGV
jgi:nucleotide-binding universal stress UspA family protein